MGPPGKEAHHRNRMRKKRKKKEKKTQNLPAAFHSSGSRPLSVEPDFIVMHDAELKNSQERKLQAWHEVTDATGSPSRRQPNRLHRREKKGTCIRVLVLDGAVQQLPDVSTFRARSFFAMRYPAAELRFGIPLSVRAAVSRGGREGRSGAAPTTRSV
jgi:hypothetical protein